MTIVSRERCHMSRNFRINKLIVVQNNTDGVKYKTLKIIMITVNKT